MVPGNDKRKAVKAVKNNASREAFIRAGLDLFGECGLEGTTTRMLAKKAGANISGIVYYFGGKDGLYQAVLERISGHFNELTADLRRESWQKLQSPLDKAQTLALVKNMISVLSRVMSERVKVKNAEKIILREQTSPTASFPILYDGYMKDMISLVRALIGRYTERSPESDLVTVQAHTLVGQFIAFIATREALLKNLGVRRLSAEQNELIHQVIMGNIESCLKSWAEEEEKA